LRRPDFSVHHGILRLRRAGLDLPTYLGELQREAERQQSGGGKRTGADGSGAEKRSSAASKISE